ncbi:MAG TPA: T9SS type A sorting domain-containing protein [Flavobacteriales bacterium]|nr:T9SS type A sorting domain-containing protein [Flavobacteriales bacterium]HNU55304.1 T9SS type A sorting domain-containing protein [Flavobacteriales bacterium]
MMDIHNSSPVGRLFCLVSAIVLMGISISAQSGSTFDPSFDANVSAGSLGYVSEVVIQDDGRVLIGGDFGSVGGVVRRGIARIHPDGQLDTSFDLGSGLYINPNPPGTPQVNAHVRSIALQPDGKILIAGAFDSVGGHHFRGLARLLSTGAVDMTFEGWVGEMAPVDEVALQSDGRILIGGYGLGNQARFVRLNADGSYDNTFQTGTGLFPASIPGIRVQQDDHILLYGGFQSYDGVQRRGLIRLEPDGQVDESFAIGIGANSSVGAMDLYPDGTILIGGRFTSINGVPRVSFARILSNGNIDPSFDAGTGAITDGSTASIREVKILSDGRICCTGGWDFFQGQTSSSIMACMLPNGDFDISFGEVGTTSYISIVAEQSDGRILIGGNFFNGPGAMVPRNKIARLMGNAVSVEGNEIDEVFDLYPNPTTDVVHVKLDEQSERSLSLYNSLAQEVHRQRFTQQTVIDLVDLPVGAYQVIVRDPGGVARVKRLVKL